MESFVCCIPTSNLVDARVMTEFPAILFAYAAAGEASVVASQRLR
jgi:hypothetical protein